MGKYLALLVNSNSTQRLVATVRQADSLSSIPEGPKVLKVTLDVTSAPFNVNQGAFTTMAQVNLLTGSAVVTALGSTSNIALGGQQTPPSMLSGTVTTVPGGYAASIPLNNVTFTFTDPASGLGGNLTLAGSFNSTYRPLNSATASAANSKTWPAKIPIRCDANVPT